MDLRLITPELLLGLLGLGLLVVELFTGPEAKRLVGWIGVAGLALALVPSAALLGGTPRLVFGGTYTIDAFAAFFKIVAEVSGILVLLAAMAFFRDRRQPHEGEVYVLTVFMVLGLVAMAAAADLILLFLAIEFVSLVSYVLAGSLKGDRKSSEAGVKYFFFGAAASAIMLYGFSYLYGAGGSTNLYQLGHRVAGMPTPFVVVAAVLILAGLGFKTSLVPFHQWTPDVYEGAPTPIAAFLSVGSKAAAFAALLRVFYVVLPPGAWVPILAALAAVTMSVGNLLALSQPNIKRMLAYSSIAHAGYMMIGVVALTASPTAVGSGIAAVLYYLLAYVFTNVGAFAVVIAAERALGSDAIADYAGFARRAPLSGLAMVVFMLSLAGVPPTALFWGKLSLFGAALQSGFGWLAVVGILNSAASLYYYLGVLRVMYGQAPADPSAVPEGGLARAVLGVTAAATLLLGVFPEPFIRLVQHASMLLRV
ncbi:MAG TPA: NADH-quinone oxidoreductase subunit N [bacterium]|nr:NADH-quinone oxidoreductase subunit N [bacterium]